MSEREAGVKLTLDDSQYVTTIKKVGDQAEHAGKKGEHAMGLFGKGVHGAMHAVHGLHRSLETVTEMVTGLAAGFSLEEALKTTIELDAKFKHLAFRIGNATGEMVNSREIQEQVEEAAAKAGQRTVTMANAFESLVKKTGDAKFAAEAIEGIGVTATATGESVETLTDLAETFKEKFGVGGKEMGDALAKAFDVASKGGPQMSDLAAVADNMGAELLQAGMGGERGLNFMLGALAKTHDQFGSAAKQVKGVKALLSGLGDEGKLKELSKHLGIDPSALLKEKDLMGRLRKVLGFGKSGIAALRSTMHESEEKKTLKILFLDPFEAALKEAGTAGLKGKKAIDSALDKLDSSIEHMGESALTAADLQKEAEQRKKDPQAQLQKALEELEHAFAQPEIIQAINDMSVALPKAAGVLADFVKFAVAHPFGAAAGVVAGKAAMGFSGSFATGLLDKALRGGAGAIADQIKSSSVVAAMSMRSAIVGAGGLAAVALAGAMAKQALDEKLGEDAKTTSDLAAAGAGAGFMGKNVAREKQQADALRKALDAAKESRSGFGGIVEDVFSGFGGMLTGETGAASLKDSQIRQMEALLQQKEAHIAELQSAKTSGGDAQQTVGLDARSHKELGKEVGKAIAGQVVRVEIVNGGGALHRGSGGGSRGPRAPAPATPGGGY